MVSHHCEVTAVSLESLLILEVVDFGTLVFLQSCFDILIIFDDSLRSVCAGIVTKKVIYYTCITFLKSNRGSYCLKTLHYFALICNMLPVSII